MLLLLFLEEDAGLLFWEASVVLDTADFSLLLLLLLLLLEEIAVFCDFGSLCVS